jgi:hypothetical protein
VSKKNVPVASRGELSAGFGAPVLLEGEDGALYDKLLTQVTAAVASISCGRRCAFAA